MTGFAASGYEVPTEAGPFSCQWDIRSVNGRGLDLRFRVPDWLDGLEAALRKTVPDTVKRGNVTVSLRLTRASSCGALRLNTEVLDTVVALAMAAESRAEAQGMGLAPMTAADLLSLRGVLETGPEVIEPGPMVAVLLGHVAPLIDAFDANRAAEGAALAAVISAQIDMIDGLTTQARSAADARRGDQAQSLRSALARLLDAAPQIEAGRFEQELALIAVKTDITEELDRLEAHVTAARALLKAVEPMGRKLDFLMQEFNREANTLCSKAQSPDLTRIGLDLKTVIDQMREQVQNLE